MKSILYVGATLMIGASIYGFVDYKNTSQKKEFTGMYDEKPVIDEPVVTEKKIAEPVVTKKEAAQVKQKTVKKQVTKKADEPISTIKPISDDAKLNPAETKIESTEVDANIAKNSNPEKKMKKKKKINRNMFSRAPIREEIELDEKSIQKSTVKDKQ